MLRLRTADGLSLPSIQSAFGSEAVASIRRALQPHVAAGRVLCIPGPETGYQHAGAGSGAKQDPAGHAAPSSAAVVPSAPSSSGAVVLEQGEDLDLDPEAEARAALALEQAAAVRLSDPDGFLLSNDIISDVFAELGSLEGPK